MTKIFGLVVPLLIEGSGGIKSIEPSEAEKERKVYKGRDIVR
jgi:hypothetical protein